MTTGELADKIFEIGRRRGFFWQSYEIYGGVAGFYDLGPYGLLLKNNIIEEWRKHFILEHQEMIVEIETPIIGPERVYIASGHVESFTDPIVKCESCGKIYRTDHLIEEKLNIKVEGLGKGALEEIIAKNQITCPTCGGRFGEVQFFNLLFKTQIGPYAGHVGYVRPEAAQGMFLAFKRVYQAMRNRLPLGIAQIGRVARNEISPRQGVIRLREFTIMEFEFFFDPLEPGADEYIASKSDSKLRILTASARKRGDSKPQEYRLEEVVEEKIVLNPWLAYWMSESQDFLVKLGISRENQFFEEKLPEERAHYSAQTFDQLVKTERWGWIEVSGHAYRTDYDLKRHMLESGKDLYITKQLKEPVKRRVTIVRVNRSELGRRFGAKAGELEKKILSEDPQKLLEAKKRGLVITIGEHEILPSMYSVEEKEIEEKVRKFIPHVIEPSFGSERLLYVVLEHSLRVKDGRIILSLPRRLAPVKVALFPLLSREDMVSKAREIYEMLKSWNYTVIYDDSGSIGRRYARADELGVPAAITVDHRTLEDDTVTLRDRDTWEQIRLGLGNLREALDEYIWSEKSLKELSSYAVK
uniref:glycine--tRNA ligase n=1 Tax=Fervidicoccus fontis TaxID=683846 RepID=A0A7J3ZL97_9CREN